MAKVLSISDIYHDRGYYARALNLGTKPDGSRWRVVVRAKTKSALAGKLAERVKELEDGTYSPGTVPTLGVWFSYWLDNIAVNRLRPNVLANYRSYGRNHVKHIKGRRLDELTPTDMRHMHKKMRAAGASDRTIQAVHNTISGALKDAVRENIIQRNVCDYMDRPAANSEPRDAFSKAEVNALLQVIATLSPKEESRWLMALLVGGRQSECLGMEWDRIGLDSNVMDLSWQLQRIPWRHGDDCGCPKKLTKARCPKRVPDAKPGYEMRPCYRGKWFVRPKTKAGLRIIPMPTLLGDALRRHRETCGGEGLVWQDAKGRPIDYADDDLAWRRLCVKAGVRELVLHSARHTMVSVLLDRGVSPEVIRQIAGHSTILSTRNYMHVSQDAARAALDAWG